MFYVRPEIKYAHAIWHIFVLAGSALHYGTIVLYVLPRTYS
jgi:hemolysin III